MKVRTTRRIDDPMHRGASLAPNVEIDVPEAVGLKLIAQGKAENAEIKRMEKKKK